MAKGWYVLNVFSGREGRVQKLITKLREDNPVVGESVFDVRMPQEDVVEVKDGKKRVWKKKILPGYVLLEMDLPEHSWHSVVTAIRRVEGVTGFLGSDGRSVKPMPIPQEEAKELFQKSGDIKADKKVKLKQSFSVDERVKIIEGPFDNFEGVIDEVNEEKGKLRVNVGIFGRTTPVEVDFLQVEKI